MYVPHAFKWNNKEEITDFIKQYNFGILVSISNRIPLATHIPMFYEEDNSGAGYLLGHLSAHNPQVYSLNESLVMAVFYGPHAYISPSLYTDKNNVPTWNYMAVHVYGICRLLKNEDEVEIILRKTIRHHEENFMEQWENLPDTYKSLMKKELTAFKIEITKTEAQKKLSQNKSREERKRIADYLLNRKDTWEKRTGEEMRKEFEDW